jgi:hypothetical protein
MASKLLLLCSILCQGLPVWYADFNHKWFADRLPKDTIVTFGTCPIPKVQACSYKDGNRYVIHLIARYNQAPDQAHFNMLHEMCHLDNWNIKLDSHGPKWQACMLHLAEAGAFHDLW